MQMQIATEIIHIEAKVSRKVNTAEAILRYAAAEAGPPGDRANLYVTAAGFEYQVYLQDDLLLASICGGAGAEPLPADEVLQGKLITAIHIVEL